jgi:hypothetical protein
MTKKSKWGNWTYDESNKTLDYRNPDGDYYEIDLVRVRTSAAMLDWIFQLRHKCWITAQDLADLLEAFDDLLDPQANYCSWEEEQHPNVLRILESETSHAMAKRLGGGAPSPRRHTILRLTGHTLPASEEGE